MKKLRLPVEDRARLRDLKCGDEVLVCGTMYTARDKVHLMTASGRAQWPFNLKDNAIFYCGPTPAVKDFPMGSCGPTTSARMDVYTPILYKKGLAVTIGKGPRSPIVVESIKKYCGLYLIAFGGCGALYGSTVKRAEISGFSDLGPQAVYRISVEDFPVIVGCDTSGRNIFS